MVSQEEQNRESAEHADIAEKKVGRGIDDYVENPEMERRITLKCDLHILPWIFILWLLAFIDRSNIGKLQSASVSPILQKLIALRERLY
jgi:hypothetical protein